MKWANEGESGRVLCVDVGGEQGLERGENKCVVVVIHCKLFEEG
jgi:hypothetical protein